MEGGLRLTKPVKTAVLKVAEAIEATCATNHIRVIKPEIPEGLADPFLMDLMKRGFSLDRAGNYVRVSIFGAVKGVSVLSGDGEFKSTDNEFPVFVSELVSLRP